jgi:cytochrome c-type biogenesis protein CcmH
VTTKLRRPRAFGHRLSSASIVLVFALLLTISAVVAAALGRRDAPRSIEDRVEAIAATLRCPVCQGLSVADSPSGVAREMRATIALRLRAGDTPSQIRQDFVDAYGDWILLAPPRRGINWLVWLLPPLIVVGGLAIGLRSARRWVAATADGAASPEELSVADRRVLDRALEAAEPEQE